MATYRNLLLTLALVCTSLTLTLSCRFDRSRFVCAPIQRGLCSGTCVMRPRMGCVCQAPSYNYDPYGYPGMGGGAGRQGGYMEPEKYRKMHPLSDRNMERSFDLFKHMVKLDRVIN